MRCWMLEGKDEDEMREGKDEISYNRREGKGEDEMLEGKDEDEMREGKDEISYNRREGKDEIGYNRR